MINNFLDASTYFGILLSLAAYRFGLFLKQKFHLTLIHPLLTAILVTIFILKLFGTGYDTYLESAHHLSYLLTPTTICLAVPLYEQLILLKQHWKAVFLGIFSGVLTSLVCIFALSRLFALNHAEYVTLLPKSITTAIALSIVENSGGYPSITVALILITGILGNLSAMLVFRLFSITEPLARGTALGTASHAIGTAKAMELGIIEGAMSSLSIAVAGILTVLCAPVFISFY